MKASIVLCALATYLTHAWLPFEPFKTARLQSLNQGKLPSSLLSKHNPLDELLGDPVRLTLHPIRHLDLWDLYTKVEASFWTVSEIDLSKDAVNGPENTAIFRMVALAHETNAMLLEPTRKLLELIDVPEVRHFLGFQIMSQNIHSQMYSSILPPERDQLFQEIEAHAERKKAWMRGRLSNDVSVAERLVISAVTKSIFSSVNLAVISALKEGKSMPGLVFAYESISSDNSKHFKFACLLFKKLKKSLNRSSLERIVMEAVDIERDALSIISIESINLNASNVGNQITNTANCLLIELGGEKMFNTEILL